MPNDLTHGQESLVKQTVIPGVIVQANPELSKWGPSLVVVREVRPWGIQGYTYIPLQGAAFIRLKWTEFELTGGHTVWDVAPAETSTAEKPY